MMNNERTVIVLDNSQIHNWCTDPELGKRIFFAIQCGDTELGNAFGKFGKVAEISKDHKASLIRFSGLTASEVMSTMQSPRSGEEVDDFHLLREAVSNYGYRLVKKAETLRRDRSKAATPVVEAEAIES